MTDETTERRPATGHPGSIRTRRLSALFCLQALLIMAACSGELPAPTLLPAADTPVIPEEVGKVSDGGEPLPGTSQPLAPAATAANGQPTATVALTRWPTPSQPGQGLRPDQAHLYRQPVIGPQATVEWRPPPLPVPLSLHPKDHYWLIRPLPSDKRNYDLEWYPYGNDVLIADLAPYKIHHGLDFPNPPGTAVLAAGSGKVIHAGVKRSRLDGVSYYGNTVVVKHDWQWQGKDVYTLYAHTLELFVEVGDYVETGQLLAGVGATGIVSGPHLHLEVRVGDNLYQNTRNPMLWIAPYEGWGTLAGRVIDKDGRFITGAVVSVKPLDVRTAPREQYTYLNWGLKPDEVWQENFVVGDLPAGRYEVTVKAGQTFQRTIEILPGRTNFLTVQTDFTFAPPTATPTVPITGTTSLEVAD